LRIRQGRRRKKTLRVLVADDSRLVRRMLVRLLAALPQFEIVGQAKDGRRALEAIRQLNPDVVILDIRMPKINGLKVLESVQQQALSCKVLVFSQLGEEPYRKRCLQLGARGFFDKVAEFDQFHQALKKMRA
jgi:DNA-binding NarL/FixJ family response regulator